MPRGSEDVPHSQSSSFLHIAPVNYHFLFQLFVPGVFVGGIPDALTQLDLQKYFEKVIIGQVLDPCFFSHLSSFWFLLSVWTCEGMHHSEGSCDWTEPWLWICLLCGP